MDSCGDRPSGSTWVAPLYRDMTSSPGSVRTNCQPASQPASPLQREGCPDEEVSRGSRCRAPSAEVKCNGGTRGTSSVVRPVVSPSAMRQRGPETEESGDDGYGGSRDEQGQREEQHNPVVQPTSGQERDRANQGGTRPAREFY